MGSMGEKPREEVKREGLRGHLRGRERWQGLRVGVEIEVRLRGGCAVNVAPSRVAIWTKVRRGRGGIRAQIQYICQCHSHSKFPLSLFFSQGNETQEISLNFYLLDKITV